ncbi:TPA: hypothetical protein DDZ01_04415, partial [Candidatus Uhrbacteria bacterium]|nr:hypothetical protein [Candidatus Uhrbacteria bacterium]
KILPPRLQSEVTIYEDLFKVFECEERDFANPEGSTTLAILNGHNRTALRSLGESILAIMIIGNLQKGKEIFNSFN